MLCTVPFVRRLSRTTLSELVSKAPASCQECLSSMLLGIPASLDLPLRHTASHSLPRAIGTLGCGTTLFRSNSSSLSSRSLSVTAIAEPEVSRSRKNASKPRPEGSVRRAKQDSKETPYANLKGIRGVGPKYAQLLAAAGYSDIRAVQELYLGKCSRDQQLFCQHLQRDVGIKLNMHQQMIANYIQESAHTIDSNAQSEAQQLTESLRRKSDNVTLSVEGNISAGKSTFLRGITDHCPDLQELIHVAPEPVDRWQKVNASNGKSYNLLDEFYQDKERFAYIFQNYIFFTRMMQEKESSHALDTQPYRLLERSIFCDRMVFVESLKDSKFMSELELTIYDSWFDPMVEMCKTLVPDGFIYLRAQPDTCMNRMKQRSRNEETDVGIEYLQDLHQRHESWLCAELEKGIGAQQQSRQAYGVKPYPEIPMPHQMKTATAEEVKRVMDQKIQIPKLPDLIANDVKFLNKNNNRLLHSSIHSLPALVLDCEKDIHDVEAQRDHANKVNCYFQYVKDTRKQRTMRKVFDQPIKEQSAEVSMQELRRSLMKGIDCVPLEWRAETTDLVENVIGTVQEGRTSGHTLVMA